MRVSLPYVLFVFVSVGGVKVCVFLDVLLRTTTRRHFPEVLSSFKIITATAIKYLLPAIISQTLLDNKEGHRSSTHDSDFPFCKLP